MGRQYLLVERTTILVVMYVSRHFGAHLEHNGQLPYGQSGVLKSRTTFNNHRPEVAYTYWLQHRHWNIGIQILAFIHVSIL